MDVTQLLIAAGVMTGLGVILSSVLALANKKLHVAEDPRIDAVEEMLPGANCGACSSAGCRAFAEQVVAGEVSPAQCSANSGEATEAIAQYLGVEAGATEKRVARLACAGGNNVARMRAHYRGIESCRAASLIAGGGKGCTYGCLGFGDCQIACPFDAITMNAQGLPVVDEARCTACGECVSACPKYLFSIHPLSHRLWVNCKSHAFGKDARSQCEVACIGCGICGKDAAEGLIAMQDRLPVVDYSKNDLADVAAIQRCPTGAIVWLGDDGVVKGEKAAVVEREEPLPVG